LYVDNILKFYENSFIIIVDNNSKHIADIIEIFKDYSNLVLLINETICKFEIGAYKVGIQYILDNQLLEKYDYYVFSQDTFILKNKYDFKNLEKEGIFASAFNHYQNRFVKNDYYNLTIYKILCDLNLQDKFDELSLCWCNSFILHKTKINEFLHIVKDIILKDRNDSMCSERYLSGILYLLNNNKIHSIEGDISSIQILTYDCWKVDLVNDLVPKRCFVKRVQQKTEKTADD